ncbi:hypothetical protein J2S30_003740 [Herbaspirillum rubrisubalbicans]|uniref:hypothetical protein n=1 Tax=Herbaspirillum rubrisubalbicans TaxID=80842 RepID=UPI0020A1470B|nr:hypothetical protein [Herbaspirillum rubrisubalbicans]MCP1575361.1 hypothetical protein [Herbaspirillum rubrisubalbicans]
MTDSQLQHERAIQLEEKKWEFKKEELAYLEAGQHVRALNQVMWQVPGMVIAITGGLWFGLTLFENSQIKMAILCLGLVINLITIRIVWRIRGVMDQYIVTQRRWQATSISTASGKHTVVWCWTLLLLCIASLNVLGVTKVEALKKVSEERPVKTSVESGALSQTEGAKVGAMGREGKEGK